MFAGGLLGTASPNVPWPPHLHFEVFYAAGYSTADASQALRINPTLFFAAATQSQITMDLEPYYPVYYEYEPNSGEPRETYEQEPFDADDTVDYDYGIADGALDRWTLSGDLYESESLSESCNDGIRDAYINLFWSRHAAGCEGVQELNTSQAEWTLNSFFTIADLLANIDSR